MKNKKNINSRLNLEILYFSLVIMMIFSVFLSIYSNLNLKQNKNQIEDLELSPIEVQSVVKRCLPPIIKGPNPNIFKLPITGENISVPIIGGGFLFGRIDKHFAPQIIRFLLIAVEVLAVGVFLYYGSIFIFAQGEEQMYTNAKKGMTFALVGIVFIAIAYALVSGFVNLGFFDGKIKNKSIANATKKEAVTNQGSINTTKDKAAGGQQAATTEEEQKEVKTVNIENRDYDVDTTKIIILRGTDSVFVFFEDLLKLTNLTILSANSEINLPYTLNKLTNLTTLYANEATEIPTTLTNLTTLYANKAIRIPDTLINLTTLSADSATEIPTTFQKLKHLKTRVKFNPDDFPELEEVWDYDNKKWKSTSWYHFW